MENTVTQPIQPLVIDTRAHSSSDPRYKLRSRDVPTCNILQAMACESCDEPSSYEEAMQSNSKEEWKIAMDDEIKSLHENKTWTLSKLPDGRKAIDSKWFFKIKYKPDEIVDRLNVINQYVLFWHTLHSSK